MFGLNRYKMVFLKRMCSKLTHLLWSNKYWSNETTLWNPIYLSQIDLFDENL